ncbi:MAG: methyltransferase [Arcobacter sp.]|nr:MAG: methyltransferase [Arcobacter sp.]
MINCPLCFSKESSLFYKDETGEYRLCKLCALVYVLKEKHLDEETEKARYDLHTNSSEDQGYRQYLSKVSTPVLERISKEAKGLDFGSGPGPTLSLLFEEAGHEMKIYDHFYAKDEAVLELKYDFITSTEVIEHLYKPSDVLDRLWNMLNDKGLLCVLTQPYVKEEAFSKWYYKNDPTHVCFFCLETMNYLAKKWTAELEVVSKDIFIFKKSI